MLEHLKNIDPEIYETQLKELKRQNEHLELIASENFTSLAVMETQGFVMTNKYAEGYPAKRYYGGCKWVDEAEELARERAKQLFDCKWANVQPHSGSQANMAVYMALLQPGDTIMGMDLTHGGHLTHGSPVNFSGMLYKVVPYGVNKETEQIDYEKLEELAKEHKPKLIMAGASAYPRVIDFERLRKIADSVGAYLVVDMAHIAGLVAAGLHPSPLKWADVVTSTTHKTLRGPRGGLILSNNEELGAKIDKLIFPGIQGGPLMHVIAAKAVAFKEALSDEFKEYMKNVVENAKVLAEELKKRDFNLVSGGTDNHLMLVNLTNKGISGKKAERLLGLANITVNKNTVPFETRSPFITSGIRIGTPAVTTRGMGKNEMIEIASYIDEVVKAAVLDDKVEQEKIINGVKERVIELTKKFPLYPNLHELLK